ncbi:DUF4595 domain-containing protein [uncultured Parabacteroides sp.]|uniref:DUF4595 domain-containing protein n=1 Tax=uncultured Parabacteroides sp. TaxID=512312 RepID=UPI0025E78F30|nr:DUF4595 domain-containing protein [uncultured Parabacteroides sp.]
MIRKLPFMLIALCFLLSCGGDDPLDTKPEDDIKPEQPEKSSEPDDPEDPENPETMNKRIKTLRVDRPSGLFTEDKVAYDEQGRITRIESHIENDGWFDLFKYDFVTTLTYKGTEVINEITCNGQLYKQILQLNETGYIEKLIYNEKEGWNDIFEYWGTGHLKINDDFYTYQYKDGNLVIIADTEGKGTPYLIEPGSISNKVGISSILLSGEYNTLDYSFLGDSDFDIAIHNSFFLFYNGFYGKPSKNLETSITSGSYSLYYEYELDEEGYPKKIICTELDNGTPIPSKESEEAFTANIEYWED